MKIDSDTNCTFISYMLLFSIIFPFVDVPVKLETDSIKYPSRGDIENPSISSQVIVQKHVWSIWAQLLKDFSISGWSSTYSVFAQLEWGL